MNIIKFSHNWNKKLNQTVFTTIRKYNYKKWNYYKGQEGTKYTVINNGQFGCDAVLIDVQCDMLSNLPHGLICTDTGMELKDAYKLFRKFGIDKHEQVIILTFERIINEYDAYLEK